VTPFPFPEKIIKKYLTYSSFLLYILALRWEKAISYHLCKSWRKFAGSTKHPFHRGFRGWRMARRQNQFVFGKISGDGVVYSSLCL